MPVPDATRWIVPDTVIGEVLDGEAVLLDLNTGVYFGLNETGARVWQLLGQSVELSGIAERVAAEFDAELSVVRADVERLVRDLSERGLLLQAEVPAPAP